MKLIYEDAAIEAVRKALSEYNGEYDCRSRYGVIADSIENLKNLPPAQSDIIYCKDCKWYGRANPRIFYRGMDCLQKRIDTIVPDRDFCSKAERREDG